MPLQQSLEYPLTHQNTQRNRRPSENGSSVSYSLHEAEVQTNISVRLETRRAYYALIFEAVLVVESRSEKIH